MSDSADLNTSLENRRKVGDILRDERILRDESLKEIAEKLAIRLPYMEAIENSKPESLPGAAYALGFVRSYADYLGMDSKSLVERYKEEAAELERETQLNFPEPLPSRGVPIGALLFIGVLLAIIFYGVWWYINSQGKSLSDYVPMLNTEEQAQIQEEKSAEQVAKEKTTVEESVVETTIEKATSTAQETAIVDDSIEETTKEATEEAAETVADAVNEVAEAPTDTLNSPEATTAQPVVEEIVTEAVPEISKTAEEATQIEETLEQTATGNTVETANIEEAVTETVTRTVAETEATVETIAPTTTNPIQTNAIETTTEENASSTELPSATPSQEEAPARIAKIYGQENSNSRVTLKALEMVWVEVTKSDGELALTRLLREGDTFLVPNETGVKMVTGNAGGIMILLDGKELGVSGKKGAVKRDFLLDASTIATQLSQD